MRVAFAQALIDQFKDRDNQVFFTGDLGYMALEKVMETFGERFINAGVAEQNMVSMAAAVARDGFIPWVYSIAPFVTLRPYEQIRNDACLHNLPVKLVGNGGGFGYGIMGGTHHNPEDIGALRILPNMKVFIPFLDRDVPEAIKLILADPSPNYLRLNNTKEIQLPIAPFQQWRCLKKGRKAVVISMGPVVHNLLELPAALLAELEIWMVGILPVATFPDELMQSIKEKANVIILEEHYAGGGLAEHLAAQLLALGTLPALTWHALNIKGYISGKYGSQQWHLEENELAGTPLLNRIEAILQ